MVERINKFTRLLTLYNTDITLDGYSIAEKVPIKETIFKTLGIKPFAAKGSSIDE